MSKPYHIVFTTIFDPTAIVVALYENLKIYQQLERTKLWIVGDIKTPPIVKDICENYYGMGFEIVYLDIKVQNNWGLKFPEFYKRIPYNNETRRNIGYLMAYEDNCNVLISIDDDNFPIGEDDFIGLHSLTGSKYIGDFVGEKNKFHNICEYLEMEPKRVVFPRGFPFKYRGAKNESLIVRNITNNRIGLTAGLWLAEPDIDATTWLNGKVTAHNYNGKNTQVLDQKTWTPINTQNTSVTSELIPAYFCIPMGWDVPGGKIQRYGDIWGGYFFQALIQGLNFNIAFGRPLVSHNRNPHDYIDDLRFEFWGMILTDWLVENLKNDFKPQGNDVIKRVFQLSDFIKSKIDFLPQWCPEEMKEFLQYTSENLIEWGKVCENISNKLEMEIQS